MATYGTDISHKETRDLGYSSVYLITHSCLGVLLDAVICNYDIALT